jgi:hypothetical protein
MIKYILVFITMALTDYFWGIYIKSVTFGYPMRAAIYGAFIMLCGAFTAISYISDHWALIPAVIGGMLGTYLSVKYNKH